MQHHYQYINYLPLAINVIEIFVKQCPVQQESNCFTASSSSAISDDDRSKSLYTKQINKDLIGLYYLKYEHLDSAAADLCQSKQETHQEMR